MQPQLCSPACRHPGCPFLALGALNSCSNSRHEAQKNMQRESRLHAREKAGGAVPLKRVATARCIRNLQPLPLFPATVVHTTEVSMNGSTRAAKCSVSRLGSAGVGMQGPARRAAVLLLLAVRLRTQRNPWLVQQRVLAPTRACSYTSEYRKASGQAGASGGGPKAAGAAALLCPPGTARRR